MRKDRRPVCSRIPDLLSVRLLSISSEKPHRTFDHRDARPFAVFVIILFIAFLPPVTLKLFPNVVPSESRDTSAAGSQISRPGRLGEKQR